MCSIKSLWLACLSLQWSKSLVQLIGIRRTIAYLFIQLEETHKYRSRNPAGRFYITPTPTSFVFKQILFIKYSDVACIANNDWRAAQVMECVLHHPCKVVGSAHRHDYLVTDAMKHAIDISESSRSKSMLMRESLVRLGIK
jgi:hypothetical protein